MLMLGMIDYKPSADLLRIKELLEQPEEEETALAKDSWSKMQMKISMKLK